MNDFINAANEPNEIVEVVNENDLVIGSITRKELDNNPNIITRKASAFIYNEKGEVLLQQRSEYKHKRPLMWSRSVGGFVRSGITPDDTIQRECYSELGIHCNFKFIGKELIKLKDEKFFMYEYIAKVNSKIKLEINKAEVKSAGFFNIDQVEELKNKMTITCYRDTMQLLKFISQFEEDIYMNKPLG